MSAEMRRLAGVVAMLAALVPASLAAQQAVPVRAGDHETFSRVVFDFAAPPEYDALLRDGRVVISFDSELAFDFGALPAEPLDRLGDPAVVRDGGQTRVALSAMPEGRLRHFLSGASVVVDIVDPAADAESARQSGSANEGEAPVTVTRDTEGAAERSSAAGDTPKMANGSPAPAEITDTPDTDMDAGDVVRVRAQPLDDGVRLEYRWQEATEAAVFRRGGYLWIVFGKPRRLDHSALDWRDGTALGDRLGPFERLAADDHTVLRYRLRGDFHLAVSRDGTRWRILVSEGETFPRRAITPRRRDGQGGPSLFVPAERIGPRLTIRDPAAGDLLEIAPLGDVGRAVATQRSFVEFGLPVTAQGIVLEAIAPDVRLVRYANGIAVEAEGGLALSEPALEARFDGTGPRRLVDLPAWRRDESGGFAETEQSLLKRLAAAPAGGRRAVRWDLARFYLGRGFAAASRGVLDLMAETDPAIAETAEWRAVSGIAELELGRPQAALKAMLAETLDRESEIWLWRALAAEADDRNEDALAYFARGKEALPSHDAAFRARLRLAMARAALERETLDIAEGHISALQKMQLDGSAAVQADLLYGRLAEARGDMATAIARYRDASAAEDRRVSAEARLALSQILLAEGDIDRAEAIARLERLRFAWRGDEVELRLLRLLGRLHVESGQYRKGLEAYRTAAATFTEKAEANAITNRMSTVFRNLFLDGRAEQLSPVEALALFYDFRELTPLGSEGDRMIRRLVDRLVAVDLLDRAAELLGHQVNFRLEGLARAIVATRLAKIYLLDGRPEEALAALQRSQDRSLPVEVLQDRALVEARALAELGRYGEALVLLEDDRRRAARELVADIHWQRQDWPALARQSAELLDARRNESEALETRERIQLIRWALALSFSDRREGLRRLRERYLSLMEGGDFAGMFNLLTSDDPPPAGEIARIAGDLSNSDRYRAFLSAYRDEFAVRAGENADALTNAS